MSSPTLDADAFLADLANIKTTVRPGNPCGAATALDSLPDALAAAVAALIDRHDVPSTHLRDVLDKHGIHLNAQTLRKHRRRSTPGGCHCPRQNEANA